MYMTRSQFSDAVTAVLGGHAAEAVVFGEMSSTAREDIARATAIVRRMVKEFGMSERLGPVSFGRKHQMVFLGRDIGEQRDYSQHVAEMIDDEIHRLVTEGHARATAILNQHRELLDRLAHALMGQESLDAPALAVILRPSPSLMGLIDALIDGSATRLRGRFRGDPLDLTRQSQSLQADDQPGRPVELPAPQAVDGRAWKRVVVVVPALAHRQ